jgi:hypothetical protein
VGWLTTAPKIAQEFFSTATNPPTGVAGALGYNGHLGWIDRKDTPVTGAWSIVMAQ